MGGRLLIIGGKVLLGEIINNWGEDYLPHMMMMMMTTTAFYNIHHDNVDGSIAKQNHCKFLLKFFSCVYYILASEALWSIPSSLVQVHHQKIEIYQIEFELNYYIKLNFIALWSIPSSLVQVHHQKIFPNTKTLSLKCKTSFLRFRKVIDTLLHDHQ